jgi:Zn-finger nucleic acid-binding protein
MNCPSCGAPMRLESDAESLTCDYCGTLVFPEKTDDGVRVLGAPTDEMCPKCAIGLVDAAFSGVRILYCTRCRGMLIGMEVFAALVQDAADTGMTVALRRRRRIAESWTSG